jgi:hypothetical protein
MKLLCLKPSGLLVLIMLTGVLTTVTNQPAIARPQPVPKESKAWGIDFYTDHFFHAANPQLKGRKLRSSDRAYIQEWQAIRRAVAPSVKSSSEVCFRGAEATEAFWEVDVKLNKNGSGSPTYDYLADTIFSHRNPEIAIRKIHPGTDAARQWSAIRSQMFVHTCGL